MVKDIVTKDSWKKCTVVRALFHWPRILA